MWFHMASYLHIHWAPVRGFTTTLLIAMEQFIKSQVEIIIPA